MFGLCRQHVAISISSTPPPSFLCKVTRGVSAFLILQYPVSFTKVLLLSCKEAGLKILRQPVCTGPDVQHTVSFKFGNKILLWIRSCSSQYQNCSCTSVLKGPSFLVTFHITENEVYLSLWGGLCFVWSNLLEIFSNICLIIMFHLNKLASLSEMVLIAGQEAFDLLCNYSQLTLGSLHYSELNLWHCVVQKGTELYPLVNLNWNTQ